VDGGAPARFGLDRPFAPALVYFSDRYSMRISSRGLYALKALLHLAEAYDRGLVKIHEIAEAEEIPEKFLEGILVTLKNARVVASQRGREGGYRLRRPPSEIEIGEVVRILDGPLAPFGDAAELAHRVRTEPRHAGLFDLFLDVRNAASAILDHTSLADVLARSRSLAGRKAKRAGRR
jgi:Rrf2 family transcriptional regulator, cysteine metabolism repressor